ncbi:MAG: hypothetical protein U0670_11105 [Anaerolineae bacterium]
MKSHIRSASLSVLGILLISLFVSVLPALAAQGGTLMSYTLNAADCYVDITAQIEDEGFYAINMWDEGTFRAGAGAFYPAGSTITVRFTIGGVILQGAPGIGVYLEDGIGAGVANTYDSNGSAQLWTDPVGTDCLNRGFTWGAAALGTEVCPNPRPAGSVIYSVPAGALAYSSPDVNSYTGFNLPAGTWYISDFGEDFAKVWIACNANVIWIPVGNIVR